MLYRLLGKSGLKVSVFSLGSWVTFDQCLQQSEVNLIASEEGQFRLKQVEKMSELASNLGITTAQLSLAWCLLNQHVNTVILGISTRVQLVANLNTVNVINQNLINSEVIDLLETIFNNKPDSFFEPSYADVTVNEN